MENNSEEQNKEQQKSPFFISPSASICKYEGWGLGGGGTLPQWWRRFFFKQSANAIFDGGLKLKNTIGLKLNDDISSFLSRKTTKAINFSWLTLW